MKKPKSSSKRTQHTSKKTLAAKRSAAARKGWRTRRRNARKRHGKKNRHFLIVIEYTALTGNTTLKRPKKILRDIAIVHKPKSTAEAILDWLYEQHEVPQFVFDSRVVRFAKGSLTNAEISWKIRIHTGDVK